MPTKTAARRSTPTATRLDICCDDDGRPVAVNFVDELGRKVEPPKVIEAFPTSWFRNRPEYGHLVVRRAATMVQRPSDAKPAVGEDGTLIPSAANQRAKGTQVDPKPHDFVHAEEFAFYTEDGVVTYRVDRQPDKYLADPKVLRDPKASEIDAIADLAAKVTPAAYAKGHTVVVHNYRLVRVDSKKG